MSEIRETSEWLKFFMDAGIPASDATNYAITFADNRIKQDMLPDLNKEYLRDMGINVLGDIIAILKHAKSVNGFLSRQRAFPPIVSTIEKKNAPSEVPIKEVSTQNSPQDSGRRNSAAERMIGHYIRKDSPSQTPVKLQATASNISLDMSSRLGGNTKGSTDDNDNSTSKSSKRSSVFNRLGDNVVTSTTNDAPKITVTMLGKEKLRSAIDKPIHVTHKPLKRMRMDEERTTVKRKKESLLSDETFISGIDIPLRKMRMDQERPVLRKPETLEYHGVLKYDSNKLEEREQSLRKTSTPFSVTLKVDQIDDRKGIRGRLGALNKRQVQSEGIFAKDYEDNFPNKKSGIGASSSKKTSVVNTSRTPDYKFEENNSLKQFGMTGKKVIKKIVKINKKTGQIVAEKTVGKARSTVFNRLSDK